MPDMLSSLETLSALILATSLAVERFIAIVKTLFPQLDIEKTSVAAEVDLKQDRPRRLEVQALALLASYLTVALVFDRFNPLAYIAIGETTYPLLLIAFLATGGSAFWNGAVGYIKEAKEARSAEKTSARLEIRMQAQNLGITTAVRGLGRTI